MSAMTSDITECNENGVEYVEYHFENDEFITHFTRIYEPRYDETVHYEGFVILKKYDRQVRIGGATLLKVIHAAQYAIDELKAY